MIQHLLQLLIIASACRAYSSTKSSTSNVLASAIFGLPLVTMHYKNVLLLASTTSAISFPSLYDISSGFKDVLNRRQTNSTTSGCPAVWNKVSAELTTMFLTGGQCNDDARAAIRLNFHECGSWETKLGATGGCDGSIILAEGELGRPENKGLATIAGKVKIGRAHV